MQQVAINAGGLLLFGFLFSVDSRGSDARIERRQKVSREYSLQICFHWVPVLAKLTEVDSFTDTFGGDVKL